MTESEDNPYSHSHEQLPPIESVLVAIAPDQVVWKHGWEAMIFGTSTQAAPPTELSLRHIPHQHADVAMPNGQYVSVRDVWIPRNTDGSFAGDTWFTLDNKYPDDQRKIEPTKPIVSSDEYGAMKRRAKRTGNWAD